MTTTARSASAVRSPRTIEIPVVPIGALLDGAARRFGDRAALVHHDDVLTYRGLWEEACGVAHALVARGIGPGDVVALHLPNRLAWPVAYHGILLAGATVALASPALPRDLLDAQLADAGAVAVVSLDGSLENVIATDGRHLDLAVAAHDTPPVVDLDPTVALAHLAYTGGTTGRSKGVELTHANVVANVLQYVATTAGAVPAPDVHGGITVEQTSPPEEHPVRLGEAVSLAVAPWFHAMGTNGLTIGLVTGTTAVVQDRFDPATYLADAERHRATTLTGAPAMYHALLAHPDTATRDLSSVRTVTSGASPMAVAQAERIAALMPDAVVVEGYGLTEATMGLCISPSERSAHRRVGTVGAPGREHRARPAARGERAARGRAGGARRAGRDLGARSAGHALLPRPSRRDRREPRRRLAADRRHRGPRRGRLPRGGRPGEGHAALQGLQRVPARARGTAGRATRRSGRRPSSGSRTTRWASSRRRRWSWRRAPSGVAELAAAVNGAVRPYERLRRIYAVDALPVSAAGKVLKGDLRAALLATEGGPDWTDG